MSRHASRKPNRKFKVPQHERIKRARKRFQAQQFARKVAEAAEIAAAEEISREALA